jgi:alkylation response protein AidB-like acyl-CoA dehydrogenase
MTPRRISDGGVTRAAKTRRLGDGTTQLETAMDAIAEDASLPPDIDAQPLVQAAIALQPELRRLHEQVEQDQRLPPTLVQQLHAAGFYRMVIPRTLGGLQVDPLTYLRVVELLAEGAGSVGWNVCNNSIGQLVTLGLPDDGVHEIYPSGHATVIAGTAVQGGGQATPVEGGYRISGRWSFGTGCQEAAWMLGSFQIMENGQPRRRPDGGTFWRAIFRREEAEVVPGSWDVTGLRGTGSFDWTVKDAFLPERRTMIHAGMPLDNQWSRWPGITYALPSVCWVGPHHSSVITGIARAGIDALIALAVDKTPRGRTGLLCENPQVQDAVGRADAILNAGRVYRSAMITELWNTVAAGNETTLEQRARCRLASTYAADSAREAMDLVYRLGGSTSFKRASRLAECWRDLHVVGQTVTVAPEWYPIGGRVYLGMDAGSRLR